MPRPRKPATPSRLKKRRHYAKKKKDAAWRSLHRGRSRAGMQKAAERLRWKQQERKRELRLPLRGYDVRRAANIDRPLLKYIDSNGCLRAEEELSAEELIRRWQESEGLYLQTLAKRKEPQP